MDGLLAFWSQALGAVAFASVLLWHLRGWAAGAAHRLLLGGLLTTATAAWLAAILPGTMLAAHAETARNLLWVAMLFVLSGAVGGDESAGRQRGVSLVYSAVALVLGLQALTDTIYPLARPGDRAALDEAAAILRTIGAAGALVLVHNLYGQAAVVSRSAIRPPMIGLAIIFVFDLNLHTARMLEVPWAAALAQAGGIALVVAAPFFALARSDREALRLKLSRAATFQSLSLLAIASYFAVMALLAAAIRSGSWDWWRGIAILVLAVLTVALAVLLPSRRARSWARVKVAKHFFEHRYDYRSEWLRFAATLGDHASADPLADRIVRAFADILEAPGGLLLAPDGDGHLSVAGGHHWPGRHPSPTGEALGRDGWWQGLADGRVIEIDALRHLRTADTQDSPLPAWLLDEQCLWVGLPLVHGDTVVGLVLLAAPELRRPLDWEDFDLLRTAGRQAASILAEAIGQRRLSEVERFDEFNRRFAFILHDIKNLVSQLKLLSRNAERHADNPEFRADMVATLKGSVGKMNDLLARLAPTAKAGLRAEPQPVSLRPLLASALAAHRDTHDVRLLGDASLQVLADRSGLEQAVAHLLSNACEASPPVEPVTIRVDPAGDDVRIEIVDHGPGMDSDFIAKRLFAPFASTKEGGFGIGAYEARCLILAMGGRLGVDSRPGKGTRFTITLPAAAPIPERLIA